MNELEAEWQLNAARLIFYERYKAALPIQTYYRRYKVIREVIRLNREQPYNNSILSDIPLGSDKYFISIL